MHPLRDSFKGIPRGTLQPKCSADAEAHHLLDALALPALPAPRRRSKCKKVAGRANALRMPALGSRPHMRAGASGPDGVSAPGVAGRAGALECRHSRRPRMRHGGYRDPAECRHPGLARSRSSLSMPGRRESEREGLIVLAWPGWLFFPRVTLRWPAAGVRYIARRLAPCVRSFPQPRLGCCTEEGGVLLPL